MKKNYLNHDNMGSQYGDERLTIHSKKAVLEVDNLKHTYTQARTCTHAHARTHARTHTHTHTTNMAI